LNVIRNRREEVTGMRRVEGSSFDE
jgi:hypothetical protein